MTATIRNPMLSVLAQRDFRLLWIGQVTSQVGDQFAMIALPWLVLQITSDPLALSTALALFNLPRAIVILLGGAITDRFSSRNVMLISDIIRLLLTGFTALVIFSGVIQMWMVYMLCLIFGTVSGFFIPASNSIVPRIVNERDLQAGNAIFLSTVQITGFFGPTLAGSIIAIFNSHSYNSQMNGTGVAFAIDAATFAISILTLWFIRTGISPYNQGVEKEKFFSSIKTGLGYVWQNRKFRVLLIFITLINFLFVGPIIVGIPILVSQQLSGSAVAYGLLMSAYAGGNLLGYLLAATLRKPSARGLRFLIHITLFIFGIMIGILGFMNNTLFAALILAFIGMGSGYVTLIFYSYIQRSTPKDMLGRVMSIIMLALASFAPLSYTVAGVMSKWNLQGLFLSIGILIMGVGIWSLFQPEFQDISKEITE
jgi:MFS family permease